MLGLLMSLTYPASKLTSVQDSQRGGKKMKEANAGINHPDTRSNPLHLGSGRGFKSGTSLLLLNFRYLKVDRLNRTESGVLVRDLSLRARHSSTLTAAQLRDTGQRVWEKGKELADLARDNGIYDEKVLNKQLILARSKLFREHAVELMRRKAGSQPPGIDGEIFERDGEEFSEDLVDYLRFTIYHPNKYRSSPVKRVWIPKPGKAEKRPLGIPTLKDRTLQMLINLVLLPLVELNADPNSYGFRPHRDCKMAIAAARTQLRTTEVGLEKKSLGTAIRNNEDK